MSAATITPTKTVRAARQADPKPGMLCVVRFGAYCTVLLPVEKGLQLVRILGDAKVVEDAFNLSGHKYYERTMVGDLQLRIIDAEDFIQNRAQTSPKESGVTP